MVSIWKIVKHHSADVEMTYFCNNKMRWLVESPKYVWNNIIFQLLFFSHFAIIDHVALANLPLSSVIVSFVRGIGRSRLEPRGPHLLQNIAWSPRLAWCHQGSARHIYWISPECPITAEPSFSTRTKTIHRSDF